MEFTGGEVAANRSHPGGEDHFIALPNRSHPGGEDRLSALPDDALVLILLRLDTATAGRTSVLSRRWRRVWTLLPGLRFPDGADPHRVRAALTAHQAALRYLCVRAVDAVPASVAAWLSAASRRLTGPLVFQNMAGERGSDEDGEDNAVEGGALELPCLENATSISLDLGSLGLALPPAGTFARLTELVLRRAWFHGPSVLGDFVSSPQCPWLQKLDVRDVSGPVNLTIHSESLLSVELRRLGELRQLIIDAPALKELKLLNNYFYRNHHTADLSAPQLVSLELSDPYAPSTIQLGNMELLQRLTTSFFLVYAREGFPSNKTILELLTRFQGIQELTLALAFPRVIRNNHQYLLEDITMAPRISFLTLIVINFGHAFGAASLFHVLRHCTGIKSLSLRFDDSLEVACPSGCICDQPINWKTNKLSLNCLQEVKILDMKGAEHKVAFLKQLFNWATVLKNMKMVFHCSVSESRALELRQALSSFFGPETCTKFYIHGDDTKLLYLLC